MKSKNTARYPLFFCLKSNYDAVDLFQILLTIFVINLVSLRSYADTKHQEIILTYQNTSNLKRFTYFVEILDAILATTEKEFGSYEFKIFAQPIGGYDLTSKMQLDPSPINFGWGSMNDADNKRLMAVHTPLYKGVIGMRVFITMPRIQKQINDSFDLNQLKKFRIGAGEDWDDVRIMREAGINVVTAKSLTELYKMLSEGKIDFVSRSIFEAYQEIADLKKESEKFIIETKIALFYKNDMLFYLPTSELKLTNRINEGMSIIRKNKVFDKIFLRHCGKELVKGMRGRKIISIPNKKYESSKFIYDKSYWYF